MSTALDLSSLAPIAPVAPDGLGRALLPFGRSTMLPRESYTSAAVLAWEQRNLIAGTWSCVGRLEELRAGDTTQRALVLGDVPVLLTFEGDAVRAFANTCRHRGHVLLTDDASSTNKSVLCVYHAWTYRLDGSLQRAPGFRNDACFMSELGLVPLPTHVWHGWLFVNATASAAPFADHLGALDELVAPYRPEDLVLRGQHVYEIAANWKLVAENYHECYHCPLIHPELCRVSIPTSGRNYRWPGAWVGGTMCFKAGAETMSFDGRSKGLPIEGAPQDSVLYVQLFPNLFISGHPDYVMTHRLLPLAPDRTKIECCWYFPAADLDPSYAIEFWDLTNAQDWRACELVQRGLTSPHFRPGPFAPNEDAVHQWVQMIARSYLGIPPHLHDS